MGFKKEGKDTFELELQIDEMVYDLYELTEEEKGIEVGILSYSFFLTLPSYSFSVDKYEIFF